MSENNGGGKGGVGFTSLLTLLFVGLKLTGVISWPWIWVLAPAWIGISLAVILIIVLVVLS